jgi:hypothetical protein
MHRANACLQHAQLQAAKPAPATPASLNAPPTPPTHTLPQVDVSISAIPGDRVLGNMPARLRRNLTDASESKQPFKWVLIMGGINDMYGGQPAQAVFEALQAMYDSSVAAGASVLALTCLPVETKAGFFSAGRLEEQPHLNQLIRSYAAGGPEQVRCCAGGCLAAGVRCGCAGAVLGMGMWTEAGV